MTTPCAVPSGSGDVVFGSPTHAIVAPSCDQRGVPSLPQLVLIFSTFLLASASANDRCRGGCRAASASSPTPNTNCLPSGDHDGAPCTVHCVPSVMRVACFVLTSTTHACANRKSPSNTRSSSRFLMLASSSALRGSVATNAMRDPSGAHEYDADVFLRVGQLPRFAAVDRTSGRSAISLPRCRAPRRS